MDRSLASHSIPPSHISKPSVAVSRTAAGCHGVVVGLEDQDRRYG